MPATHRNALLKHFELPPADGGAEAASTAARGTRAAPPADMLESFCPSDASLIGRVPTTSAAGYEAVMGQAVAAARSWADVPAPQRGDLVRALGDELRRHKRELAELVALENGKILAEGLGEVQEMIDMADLAIGQSRMLYGRTMHSERSQHRMYEQWHPLGVVGVITAFNFPVAVWSWNALLAAVCGNATVWKPSPKTPLCALAVQRLCEQVLEHHNAPPVFQLLIDAGSELGSAPGRRCARQPGVLHRFHRGRAPDRAERGGAAGPHPARARRQQRHHRR